MSISSVVTRGYGDGVNSLVARGYLAVQVVVTHLITDTINYLLLPVNCVLIGEQKEPKDMKYENEQQSIKQAIRQSYGGGFKIGKSTFAVKTDSKGYD